MKVTIESTTRIIEIDGKQARIWQGETDSGIKIIMAVSQIAVPEEADQGQFKKELKECAPPSQGAMRAIPYDRMWLN